MLDYKRERTTGSHVERAFRNAGTPGKRTLTESLPVQHKAAPAAAPALGRTLAADPAWVASAAGPGIEGTGGPLPHLDRIQALFGAHDVRGVEAFVGGRAAEAAGVMGATAYATGNKIAFAGAPDLHTAAHEAAHVVQQRAGVSLYGGVGRPDDDYERQADRVADAVVRGESAERLLGTPAAQGASAAATGRGHGVQRNLDPQLATEIGSMFQKQFIDGEIDKKQMAVIERVLRLQIDGSIETTRIVEFLFSELDNGKSELLRQGLFTRGGLAAQLAIDRTRRQITYYTAMNDQQTVTWYQQTTPVPYQPYLQPNHNQPQLQQVNAVHAPVPPPLSDVNTLTGLFTQNQRKVPPQNNQTKIYAAPGVGGNNALIVRKGHIQRRHMFETFDFSPENIYRYEYNNRVHSFFAPGTKVGTLVAQLLLQVGTALGAAQSDPNQATFAGSSGGMWFSFRFDRNAQTVTLEQLYPLGGTSGNTDDLKAIGKNQGWGSYQNHQETNNPGQSQIYPNGQYQITPISRERFGNNRIIEHWDDQNGARRYTEKRGPHNRSGWREDHNNQGQLENGSYDSQQHGIAWTPRLDNGEVYGRYDFNQQQTMYKGWRTNNQNGNEFLPPTQNPQPGSWRGLQRTQPNGGEQIEVTDPNNQNQVESGRRVNSNGTVDTWDPNAQQWYQDPGREQQTQDYYLGELAAIANPAQAPQGSMWLVYGYQSALPRYQQAQTDCRQQLDGGNANPQTNSTDHVYVASWAQFLAGWNAAQANPDGQPPQDVRQHGAFQAYVQTYDMGALVLQLAFMLGNFNANPTQANPAYLAGWNEFQTGWTYAANNPQAQAPIPNTRASLRGFNFYRQQHPPQHQHHGNDDHDDHDDHDDNDGGGGDDGGLKRLRQPGNLGKQDPHIQTQLPSKRQKVVHNGQF